MVGTKQNTSDHSAVSVLKAALYSNEFCLTWFSLQANPVSKECSQTEEEETEQDGKRKRKFVHRSPTQPPKKPRLSVVIYVPHSANFVASKEA